jgi:hypothetical protein
MKLIITLISLTVGLFRIVAAELPSVDAPNGTELLPFQEYPSAADKKNWGDAVEGFQIALELDKSEVPEGEPILATVFIRNVSEKPLSYFVSIPERNSRIVVTDQTGQELAQKRTAKTAFSDRIIASKNYTTQPGHQRQYTIRLDQLFDFKSSETYSVRVHRVVPKTNSATLEMSEAWSPSANLRITRKALNAPREIDPNSTSQSVSGLGAKTNVSSVRAAPFSDRTDQNRTAPSNSPDTIALPLSYGASMAEGGSFTPRRKIGAGILAVLLALSFVFLWRAARRKWEG